MSNNTMYFSTPVLPWDRSAEEERLFRKLAAVFGVIFLILCLVLAVYPVPEKKREQVERIPPRLAKLVMEKQKPPPPPPPPKEEPKKEEPKPEEKKKEETKKEEPKKEEPKKEPPKKTAKEKAKAHMAVFDDLADLRDTQDLAELKADQKQVSSASLGAQQTQTQRALIGSNAIGGSGGVAVSKASSGGGGSGSLANVSSTKVESNIADPVAQNAEKRGKGGKARRTTEDVQLVFDRNKGTIYGLYRRALRNNPALEGTLVLRLEIQPNGSVTKCEVVSSDLKDPDLERKIVVKVKQINFGKMDVDVWRDTYPISFIPS